MHRHAVKSGTQIQLDFSKTPFSIHIEHTHSKVWLSLCVHTLYTKGTLDHIKLIFTFWSACGSKLNTQTELIFSFWSAYRSKINACTVVRRPHYRAGDSTSMHILVLTCPHQWPFYYTRDAVSSDQFVHCHQVSTRLSTRSPSHVMLVSAQVCVEVKVICDWGFVKVNRRDTVPWIKHKRVRVSRRLPHRDHVRGSSH